jgi:kynurenine formamidase
MSTSPPPLSSEAEFEVVDLSVTIAEDLPCYWTAHIPFQHKTWNWFGDRDDPGSRLISRSGPYATMWLLIDEHTGTHVDAPTHFIPPPKSDLPEAGPAGMISVDVVPVEQLMGPAAVVDATSLLDRPEDPGVSPIIEPELLVDWEERYGRLGRGEIVLLRTGWDARYRRGEAGRAYVEDVLVSRRAAGWPAPDVPAMELLLDRGVRCVGIDAPTMGPAQGGQAVHVRALGTGAIFIEGLTALGRLPARGAWFCFLPLKIEGGTGAPGRAVAIVPKG